MLSIKKKKVRLVLLCCEDKDENKQVDDNDWQSWQVANSPCALNVSLRFSAHVFVSCPC